MARNPTDTNETLNQKIKKVVADIKRLNDEKARQHGLDPSTSMPCKMSQEGEKLVDFVKREKKRHERRRNEEARQEEIVAGKDARALMEELQASSRLNE